MRTADWSRRARGTSYNLRRRLLPGTRSKLMIQAVVVRCAGIDVGKTFVVVCVMTGAANAEPQVERRRFGTFNEDLERLRLWLEDEGCTHAVMESTGSYWKPIFNILEESIEVILTNARD